MHNTDKEMKQARYCMYSSEDIAFDEGFEAGRLIERERNQKTWIEFFSTARLENTITGNPITNLEEYNEWKSAYYLALIQSRNGHNAPPVYVTNNPADRDKTIIELLEKIESRQSKLDLQLASIQSDISALKKMGD